MSQAVQSKNSKRNVLRPKSAVIKHNRSITSNAASNVYENMPSAMNTYSNKSIVSKFQNTNKMRSSYKDNTSVSLSQKYRNASGRTKLGTASISLKQESSFIESVTQTNQVSVKPSFRRHQKYNRLNAAIQTNNGPTSFTSNWSQSNLQQLKESRENYQDKVIDNAGSFIREYVSASIDQPQMRKTHQRDYQAIITSKQTSAQKFSRQNNSSRSPDFVKSRHKNHQKNLSVDARLRKMNKTLKNYKKIVVEEISSSIHNSLPGSNCVSLNQVGRHRKVNDSTIQIRKQQKRSSDLGFIQNAQLKVRKPQRPSTACGVRQDAQKQDESTHLTQVETDSKLKSSISPSDVSSSIVYGVFKKGKTAKSRRSGRPLSFNSMKREKNQQSLFRQGNADSKSQSPSANSQSLKPVYEDIKVQPSQPSQQDVEDGLIDMFQKQDHDEFQVYQNKLLQRSKLSFEQPLQQKRVLLSDILQEQISAKPFHYGLENPVFKEKSIDEYESYITKLEARLLISEKLTPGDYRLTRTPMEHYLKCEQLENDVEIVENNILNEDLNILEHDSRTSLHQRDSKITINQPKAIATFQQTSMASDVVIESTQQNSKIQPESQPTVPFQPIEVREAEKFKSDVTTNISKRINRLQSIKQRIVKHHMEQERQRLYKKHLKVLKQRIEYNSAFLTRMTMAVTVIQRSYRRRLARKAEAKRQHDLWEAKMNLQFADHQATELQKFMSDYALQRYYKSHIDKIILIQHTFKDLKNGPSREQRLHKLRLTRLAKLLFETFCRYLPKPLAFRQLKSLKHKQRSMSLRAEKRVERADFLTKRKEKRKAVNQVKLNFVAGLLNRFYRQFLDEFRLQGLAWRKFGKTSAEVPSSGKKHKDRSPINRPKLNTPAMKRGTSEKNSSGKQPSLSNYKKRSNFNKPSTGKQTITTDEDTIQTGLEKFGIDQQFVANVLLQKKDTHGDRQFLDLDQYQPRRPRSRVSSNKSIKKTIRGGQMMHQESMTTIHSKNSSSQINQSLKSNKAKAYSTHKATSLASSSFKGYQSQALIKEDRGRAMTMPKNVKFDKVHGTSPSPSPMRSEKTSMASPSKLSAYKSPSKLSYKAQKQVKDSVLKLYKVKSKSKIDPITRLFEMFIKNIKHVNISQVGTEDKTMRVLNTNTILKGMTLSKQKEDEMQRKISKAQDKAKYIHFQWIMHEDNSQIETEDKSTNSLVSVTAGGLRFNNVITTDHNQGYKKQISHFDSFWKSEIIVYNFRLGDYELKTIKKLTKGSSLHIDDKSLERRGSSVSQISTLMSDVNPKLKRMQTSLNRQISKQHVSHQYLSATNTLKPKVINRKSTQNLEVPNRRQSFSSRSAGSKKSQKRKRSNSIRSSKKPKANKTPEKDSELSHSLTSASFTSSARRGRAQTFCDKQKGSATVEESLDKSIRISESDHIGSGLYQGSAHHGRSSAQFENIETKEAPSQGQNTLEIKQTYEIADKNAGPCLFEGGYTRKSDSTSPQRPTKTVNSDLSGVSQDHPMLNLRSLEGSQSQLLNKSSSRRGCLQEPIPEERPQDSSSKASNAKKEKADAMSFKPRASGTSSLPKSSEAEQSPVKITDQGTLVDKQVDPPSFKPSDNQLQPCAQLAPPAVEIKESPAKRMSPQIVKIGSLKSDNAVPDQKETRNFTSKPKMMFFKGSLSKSGEDLVPIKVVQKHSNTTINESVENDLLNHQPDVSPVVEHPESMEVSPEVSPLVVKEQSDVEPQVFDQQQETEQVQTIDVKDVQKSQDQLATRNDAILKQDTQLSEIKADTIDNPPSETPQKKVEQNLLDPPDESLEASEAFSEITVE